MKNIAKVGDLVEKIPDEWFPEWKMNGIFLYNYKNLSCRVAWIYTNVVWTNGNKAIVSFGEIEDVQFDEIKLLSCEHGT